MTTEKFSWLRIAAWSLLLLACLFFYSTAEAQNSRIDGIVFQRNGYPAPGATIAVLNQIAITAASESTNTVTITSSLNPAQGSTVTITGMVPNAYNGSYTVLTTSPTQFTYTNPTSSLGVGTLFGSATVTSTTPGSPLASLCASSSDTTCAAPNPVTADGLGNYSLYAKPGKYTLQFYGSGLTARLQPDQILACDPTNCTILGTLSSTGSATFPHLIATAGLIINGGLELTSQTGTGQAIVTSVGPNITIPVINQGVSSLGTGSKHIQSTTNCTTGAAIGAACTTAAINWQGSAFIDTNYSLTCTLSGSLTNVPVVVATAKSTGSFTVTIAALTAAAASFSEVDCKAEHD